MRWYYRPDGKHMWRAKKWTISVYRFVINTAAVQGYITHLMLVRLARAEFDLMFEVWLARRNRLRNTPQLPLPANEQEEKKLRRQQILEYERAVNVRRPRPLTHVQFRVQLVTALVERHNGAVPVPRTSPTEPSSSPVVRRRRRGRPTAAAAAESTTVPNRTMAKRKVQEVTVVCDEGRQDRKRVRAQPRLMPTKRLSAGGKRRYVLSLALTRVLSLTFLTTYTTCHRFSPPSPSSPPSPALPSLAPPSPPSLTSPSPSHTRARRYDIHGEKAKERFCGGECIPGMNPLLDVVM